MNYNPIQKVTVIGAGVMGASIAAHIANAGVAVRMLDVVPDSGGRNSLAQGALRRLLATKPAAFMVPANAKLITCGNIEDDLPATADADWVIEAIVENCAIKQDLYQQLAANCGANTIISSNTSTIPLQQLLAGFDQQFRSRFMISHFFNPPRYMRLLELVFADETLPQHRHNISQFAEIMLGKGCVECRDTVGFIANRIGIYWMQYALTEAIRQGITVEEADSVFGAFGIPKTGVFGLLDLVGLDLMPHILQSMQQVPAGDAFHKINETPALLTQMLAKGYTGRKGKGGFYRLNNSAGRRVKEYIDLDSGEYLPCKRPRLECLGVLAQKGLPDFLQLTDKYSRYGLDVMRQTLLYAAGLVPQIGDINSVDTAMRLGYNWQYGPFELLDKIGQHLVAQNHPSPPPLLQGDACYQLQNGKRAYRKVGGGYQPINRSAGVRLLSDIKLQKSPLLSNASASLWDVGSGVACLEFHSKMNTFDQDILQLLGESLQLVRADFQGLVIHNEADNFSAGANLLPLVAAIHQQNWQAVDDLIKQGQSAFMAVKYAPFPVVAAPSGLAIGGGCEILLHCDAIVSSAELYTGLVEVGVGLVPGWGGCKEYLRRCLQNSKIFGPIPSVTRAFQTIATAKVATSAADAKRLLFLHKTDVICPNKDYLLATATQTVQNLAKDYQPPTPFEYKLAGKTAKVLLDIMLGGMKMAGKISDYDRQIGGYLATVLSGGNCDITKPISENEMLDLERQVFTQISHQPKTLARLESMLKTGKPLRN